MTKVNLFSDSASSASAAAIDTRLGGNATDLVKKITFDAATGRSRRMPAGTTALSQLNVVGWYYLTTAEFTAMTDKPTDAVLGGIWLEVSAGATDATFHQRTVRNSSTSGIEQYIRQVSSTGAPGAWSKWVKTLDSVSVLAAPTTDFSMNSKRLTSLATPISATDGATKAYVDAVGDATPSNSSIVRRDSTGAVITTGVDAINTDNQPSATVVLIKGAAGQTGRLTTWQDSTGLELAYVNKDGSMGSGNIQIVGNTPTSTPLWVTAGSASQTGDLQRWRSQAGVTLGAVKSDGTLCIGTAFAGAAISAMNDKTTDLPTFRGRASATQASDLLRLENNTGTAIARVTFDGSALWLNTTTSAATATSVPLTVKGAASQTGLLTNWTDSAGTTIASVKADGTVTGTGAVLSGGAASTVALTVKGGVAQTADLASFQDSTGAVLARMDNAGAIFAPTFVLGDVTSTSQKILYNRALNSVNSKAYENRRYLSNTTGASGCLTADVLFENSVEVARTELSAAGHLYVRKGDVIANNTKDTGDITTVASVITAVTTDWSVTEVSVRKIGLAVDFYMALTYIGASVTPPADGNITNINVGTIAAAYRPRKHGAANTTATGRMGSFYVEGSTGVMQLTGLANTAALANPSNFSIQGFWMANAW